MAHGTSPDGGETPAPSDEGRRFVDRLEEQKAPSLEGESLRADWLKLRGYLFDPHTRLPALPAILDDVRRRLEDGHSLALLYLDLSAGGQAETSHGWQAHDEVLRHVADSLFEGCRRLDCRAQPRQALLAQVGVRSDEFVVFLEPSPDEESDLESVHRQLRDAVSGAVRHASLEGETPQIQSALVDLRLDPTLRIERAIYRALSRARDLCREELKQRASGRLRELRRMLEAEDVVIRYQPIVDLESGVVHGLEALSGAPHAETFETPETLFAFAEQSDSTVDLERMCMRLAVSRAAGLVPEGGKLFLNSSAHAFVDGRLVDDLLDASAAAGWPPESLVLEVTERVAITEWRSFHRALDRVRSAGLGVAIDDMGSGFSSLHAVAEIQPDYLKFDLTLVHGIHRSAIKRDLFETLVSLAEKIGALAIAEGIEEAEEYETVRRLGVRLGQGFFFARPAVPEAYGEVHVPAG